MHILIHCSKARALWELLLALFGVCWVLPSSARETLIEWKGFMLGKKHSMVWKAALLCLFWAVWMEKNRIAFDNEDFSVHRLKNSFVCNLWVWTKSIVNEGPLTLPSFLDWLGARWGSVLYFLFFCVCLKGPFVYSLYAIGFSSWCPFLIYFCFCLSKKKITDWLKD